jgi:hypothetical protein
VLLVSKTFVIVTQVFLFGRRDQTSCATLAFAPRFSMSMDDAHALVWLVNDKY